MKRSVLSKAAMGMTACTIALSLTACGGAGDIRNSTEPVTASQAFDSEGIWFSSDEPGKEESISAVLYFDGKGNVTRYDTHELTYGDLRDMNDDEIIERAKAEDRESFDRSIEHQKATLENRIEDLEGDLPRYQDDYHPDMAPEEIEYLDNEIAGIEEAIARQEQHIADYDALAYQEPQPMPFKLTIETDDSGNLTARERIHYSFLQVPDWEYDEPLDKLDKAKVDHSIETYAGSISYPVFDMMFNGYPDAYLWTMVGEDFVSFTMDDPGVEGIEVD